MKKIKYCFKLMLLLSVLALTPSCAVIDWFGAKVDDSEVTDLDKDITPAKARITRYDKSLRTFGRILEAYNIQTVRVQSKIISNDTAVQSLPQDISKMLITGINKIGKEVIYIPFDPNYVISESTTGGNINRMLPQIVISGGITEFDKDMIEKSRELNTEAQIQEGQWGSKYDQDYGLGYDASQSVSRIALDLHLLDYVSQASISQAQSSNAINLRKTKLGWAVGAFFAGCGLTFDYKLKKKQGMYYALRLLVELSTLEVLGKYFDVPYWRCLPGAQEDEQLMGRLYEEFNDLSDDEQIAYIKEYLFFHGEDVDRATSEVTAKDRSIVSDAMTKYNCSTNGDLFLELWKSVPIEESRKRNRTFARTQKKIQRENEKREGQRRREEEQIRAAEIQRQQAEQKNTPSPQPIPAVVQVQAPKQQVSDIQEKQYQPNTNTPSSDYRAKSNKEVPVGFGTTEW